MHGHAGRCTSSSEEANHRRLALPIYLSLVSTHLYPGKVVIVANDVVAASHERLSDRGQTKYDWQHYIPLIQRKPGASSRTRLSMCSRTRRAQRARDPFAATKSPTCRST